MKEYRLIVKTEQWNDAHITGDYIGIDFSSPISYEPVKYMVIDGEDEVVIDTGFEDHAVWWMKQLESHSIEEITGFYEKNKDRLKMPDMEEETEAEAAISGGRFERVKQDWPGPAGEDIASPEEQFVPDPKDSSNIIRKGQGVEAEMEI